MNATTSLRLSYTAPQSLAQKAAEKTCKTVARAPEWVDITDPMVSLTYPPDFVDITDPMVSTQLGTKLGPTANASGGHTGLRANESQGLTNGNFGVLTIVESLPAVESPVLSHPMSRRHADPADLKVAPELISDQHVVFMNAGPEAKGFFDRLMGDKPVRLATAGYSAPPEGYESATAAFLHSLCDELSGQIGLVTSPTADQGSIDAITSTVGQRHGAPVGYVTADSYLGYISVERFPAELDRDQFKGQPKFSFADGDIYSKATAELSNSILVTGGRNAAVQDFMNGIRNGNRAVVLTNDEVAAPAWDPKKNRVDNASAYLKQMLSGDTTGIPMDHPFNLDVQRFVTDHLGHEGAVEVLMLDAQDQGAARTAAKHLKGAN